MSRYPYTYACDYIRMEMQEPGRIECKWSRSEASQVRALIADALGISDEEVAKKLADKFVRKYGD